MGLHRPERLHALVDVAEALGLGSADVLKLARAVAGSGLHFEQNTRRPRVVEFLRPAFVTEHLADLDDDLGERLAEIEAREGFDHAFGEMWPICAAEAEEARRAIDKTIERDRFTDRRPEVGADGVVSWEPVEPEYEARPRSESTYAAHRREQVAKWGGWSHANRLGVR